MIIDINIFYFFILFLFSYYFTISYMFHVYVFVDFQCFKKLHFWVVFIFSLVLLVLLYLYFISSFCITFMVFVVLVDFCEIGLLSADRYSMGSVIPHPLFSNISILLRNICL